MARKHKPISQAETRRLIRLAQDGDEAALERLVTRSSGLVYKWVAPFLKSNRGIDMDDFMQAGTLGLIRAIKTFDLSRDIAFSTWVFHQVRVELQGVTADFESTPRSAVENKVALAKIRDRLTAELERDPTYEEMAEVFNQQRQGRDRANGRPPTPAISVAQVERLMIRKTPLSLDADFEEVSPDGGPESMYEILPDSTFGSTSGNALSNMEAERMLGVIRPHATEQEFELLLLQTYTDMSNAEIAEILGLDMSQFNYVRQALMRKLRVDEVKDEIRGVA